MQHLKIFLLFFILISFCSCTHLNHPIDTEVDETVVLIHGLFRTDKSMANLDHYLQNHGYNVINIDYQSTRYPIETLVKQINKHLVSNKVNTAKKVHFVTHSLGGIVTRLLLKEYPMTNLGRVVMLSPPNRGSELIDTFKEVNYLKEIAGPAAISLGTMADSLPNRLGPVDYELGIITGNWSFNPIYSAIIPGDDDGKVSVERAKIKGMKDFLVLPYSHTFIMNKPRVQKEVLNFLLHGAFSKS